MNPNVRKMSCDVFHTDETTMVIIIQQDELREIQRVQQPARAHDYQHICNHSK